MAKSRIWSIVMLDVDSVRVLEEPWRDQRGAGLSEISLNPRYDPAQVIASALAGCCVNLGLNIAAAIS